RKYGKARRVWVFDRGIVSKENLQMLRQRDGQYLVGTPRSKLRAFEKELPEGSWEKVRPDVEVKLVSIPGGEETYVLCRTTARRKKEQAIRSRFSTRIESALSRLQKHIAEGKLKDRNKMERSLGAIQARYSQVADHYDLEVAETTEGWRLGRGMIEDRESWQERREGHYLVRTNRNGGRAVEHWAK